MLFTTRSPYGRLGTALITASLLTAVGLLDSTPADRHMKQDEAYAVVEPSAEPEPPSVSTAAAAAKTGDNSASGATVRERLSKIKSKQELIEKNKRFPMLHQDATEFIESVEVVATGYYAGIESTGKSPGHPLYGITYSGVRVKQDVLSTIAADPKIFPLGTILYIPGYGYGIVADTGSAIKGHKIDLYYETKEQIYKEWGKRTVNVFVVRKGDGRVSEETLDRWSDILSVYAAAQHDQPLEL